MTSSKTSKATPAARPTGLLGYNEIGALFGVTGDTVNKWIHRYKDTHPTPPPDHDTLMVWLPRRVGEWRLWEQDRPGRGAGGGRPWPDQAEVTAVERRARDVARAERRLTNTTRLLRDAVWKSAREGVSVDDIAAQAAQSGIAQETVREWLDEFREWLDDTAADRAANRGQEDGHV